MKPNDGWEVVKEEPWWTGGTVVFYDTGDRKNYAAVHKETGHFMGWISKSVIKA